MRWQILGNGRADIPREESKMGKKAGVGMDVIREKAGFNVGARKQKLFNVVLGVKLRRMNWKTPSKTDVARDLHKEAFKIEA